MATVVRPQDRIVCAGCGLTHHGVLVADSRTGYRPPWEYRTQPTDTTAIVGLVEVARGSAAAVGLTVEVYLGTALEDIMLVVRP